MLGNASETEFDIRFSVLGIPCRVHPGFWLLGVLTSLRSAGGYADILGVNILSVILLWFCIIFVSILVHELGHALVMRWFGGNPHMVLYHMGGYASDPFARLTPWRDIVMSAAGPVAGFLLYGLIEGFDYLARSQEWFVGNRAYWYIYTQFSDVNLWWGLLNLLPVFPLDGGRICSSILNLCRVRNYEVRTAQVGMFVGGCVAAYCFLNGRSFAGFLFLMLAAQNYQAAQNTRW